MLLARECTNPVYKDSLCGDERKEETGTNSGGEVTEIEVTAGEGKASAENKVSGRDSNNSGEGNRRGSKNRHKNARDERDDEKLWRSAKELGIRWIGSECGGGFEQDARHNNSKPKSAHWYIAEATMSGGTIFLCRKCAAPLWMPNDYSDSLNFGVSGARDGMDKTYQKFVGRRVRLRDIMAELMVVWKLDISVGEKLAISKGIIHHTITITTGDDEIIKNGKSIDPGKRGVPLAATGKFKWY